MNTHRRIMENIKIGEKYDIKEWMKIHEKIGKQYLEYLNSLGRLKNEI